MTTNQAMTMISHKIRDDHSSEWRTEKKKGGKFSLLIRTPHYTFSNAFTPVPSRENVSEISFLTGRMNANECREKSENYTARSRLLLLLIRRFKDGRLLACSAAASSKVGADTTIIGRRLMMTGWRCRWWSSTAALMMFATARKRQRTAGKRNTVLLELFI